SRSTCGRFWTIAGLRPCIKAGMMVLKKSADRMLTISSLAAAMASGEGVCARAGTAADKQATRQTVSIHECLRMKILLLADVPGSYLVAAATERQRTTRAIINPPRDRCL